MTKKTLVLQVFFFFPSPNLWFWSRAEFLLKKKGKNISHFLKNSPEKSGFFEDLFQNKLHNKTKINQDPLPRSPTQ